MAKLEQKFNENLEAWREHCLKTINSSNPNDYLDCDAYRNIVVMGKEVLPLIRRTYDTESKDMHNPNSLRWELSSLVRKITGQPKIPNWMRGKIEVIAKFTVKWLDENMHKYVGE